MDIVFSFSFWVKLQNCSTCFHFIIIWDHFFLSNYLLFWISEESVKFKLHLMLVDVISNKTKLSCRANWRVHKWQNNFDIFDEDSDHPHPSTIVWVLFWEGGGGGRLEKYGDIVSTSEGLNNLKKKRYKLMTTWLMLRSSPGPQWTFLLYRRH